jgi:hypothetical protein
MILGSKLFTSIGPLFVPSGPTNIVRAIVAVWIDTIEGTFWWSFSNFSKNITEKFFKFIPAFTDRNAQCSVVFVIYGILIVTSGEHIVPRTVEIMSFSSSGKTMAVATASAATRAYVTGSKTINSGGIQFVANTTAKPQNVAATASFLCWSDSSKVTEFLICDIDWIGHRSAPTVRGSSDEVAL